MNKALIKDYTFSPELHYLPVMDSKDRETIGTWFCVYDRHAIRNNKLKKLFDWRYLLFDRNIKWIVAFRVLQLSSFGWKGLSHQSLTPCSVGSVCRWNNKIINIILSFGWFWNKAQLFQLPLIIFVEKL